MTINTALRAMQYFFFDMRCVINDMSVLGLLEGSADVACSHTVQTFDLVDHSIGGKN